MVNPLIAEREDSTTAYSGISLAESANDLKQGIEKGDWAAVAMGAVGTALDALSMAMDPFGAVLAAGVGWLMEHVGPLSDALDGLTGDADQIKSQAETWANAAKELGAIGTDLSALVEADLQSWTGEAADAYRQRTKDMVDLLTAAQKGCEGASSGVQTAGEVVAAVRSLVRDIIAELIGHLISWALQVLFTLGIGMTWVVPQVAAAVAKTASQIASITTKLVKALKGLMPLLKRAGSLFDEAGAAMRKIKGGKADAPPPPRDINGKGGNDRGLDTKKDDDGTDISSAGNDGNHNSGNGNNSGNNSGGGNPRNDDQTDVSGTGDRGGDRDRGGGGNDTTGKDGKDGKDDRSTSGDAKNTCGDPIDVATGEVVMTQVDVTLPGDGGDLQLSRTHLSSYTGGRWFGPSWTSTVDQRLELDGSRVRFYSEDGMVLTYPVPAGEPVLPEQGPRHRLARTPEGYRLSFGDRELHFAGSGAVLPLVAIEQGGSRTEFGYAADGTPAKLRRDDGVELTISTEQGRIVAFGAPEQAPLVRFSYNRLGQLSTIADFAGRPQRLDYDFGHRLVGWQDRTGTWYRYVYDGAGRCVRAVGANGYYNATFVYEPGTTRHTDATGHTWSYRFNDAKQLIERVDPLGNSRRYQWNRRDELLSQVDEIGRETGYEYDDGELVAVHHPGGSTVRVAPAEGGETLLRAGEGTDEIQRVVPASDPAATLVEAGIAADLPGAPDPFEDDPVTGRSARPGDRDLFGRPRLVHTASGGAARLGWTADGRRAWRLGPHGARETWVHDAEGQVVEYRDAGGAARRRKYGPFGLVLEETDTAGARTLFTYDGELRLTSVTNPSGLVWQYVYDAAGRLVEEIDYDGRRLAYTYDAAGQLRRMTNGMGVPTEYDYDVHGNVVVRRTPDDLTLYEYDALGRLTVAENTESRVEIVRDGSDRVITDTINGIGVCWRHDGEKLVRRTSSGVDSEWRFGESGLPRSLRIAGHDVEFAYDDVERESTRSVDGTVVLQRRFDAEDRLAEEDVAGVGLRTYSYRPDGRLAAVGDAIRPWQLSFDNAGRVSEARGPAGVEQFTYDAAGTMTSAVTPSLPGPRTYAGNWIVSAGDTYYSADAQGRVTGRYDTSRQGGPSCTYAWDHLDRLRSAVTPDGALWTYHYDPLGRRFAKRRFAAGEGGEAELTDDFRFLWNEMTLVERVEYRPADNSYRILTWEHLYDDDRPVVQVETAGPGSPARFRAVITSPAGKPTELLDEHGALVWQDRSSFWGAPLPGADSAAIPLAFPGQHRDEETGLHYNVYRYYDPQTTRYLSQDPIGLAAAPNPVGYVDQPLLVGDPLGLVGTCGATGPQGGTRSLPGPPPRRREFRERTDFRHDVDSMTKEEFERFKPQLDEMLKADKHFFWSGGFLDRRRAPGDTSDPYLGPLQDRATQIARQHGGNTLEGTLYDNKIKMPGWVNDPNDPRKALVEEKWKYVSERWANNSPGSAHVVFPGRPDAHSRIDLSSKESGPDDIYSHRREGNVWDTIEYPRLRDNGITDITKYDSETGNARPYRHRA
ncbi:DUF6531 domain-containing protein [Amycolatopsis jiangsuensis]|uniref:RHS repeat-associated protein n=1 Tax=Amycolatopsis jiangsuensis TaxID=1181879 RepID=A0A840IW66_9PSEU|nr:DUF6531 domain-containing protein [Amycolatopsis jiangsuensis]MBB4685759.1 RHS repeat-associated protein [Amycolatopsis jiangsuensis]